MSRPLSKYGLCRAHSSSLRHAEQAPAEAHKDDVALRAFFRLAELWGLTMEQARLLLGTAVARDAV